MTTYFVSSVDGNNADSGLTWALAKQTVAGALAVPAVSGDIILVDSAHAFTATAAITWTPPAGNIAIISVNRAGGDAWLAGASESIGAANSQFLIANAAGSAMFVYGMSLFGGTNNNANCFITLLTSTSGISSLEMVSCTINLQSVNTSGVLNFGTSVATTARSNRIRLLNCTLQCDASRAGTFALIQRARVELINPAFAMNGATKPAILFAGATAGDTGSILIRDADLTGYAVSGGAYFGVANFNTISAVVENCKISATPSITTGAWPGGEASITLRNVDSGDTINSFEYRDAYGTITENASIYFDAGADFNGAGISWQIVTTAAANEYTPFVTPIVGEIWNTTTSAQTAEIELVRDSATALTDREIWSGIDYPASASFPNYTRASNRHANPFTGTGAAQPTSTGAWTGTGGFSNTTKQKLQHAFTAAEVGMLTARVHVGKASETLYLHPDISNVT